MEKLLEIASKISSPIALAGVFGIIVLLIFQAILSKNIFPSLTKQASSDIIKQIIRVLFILAALAMVLGFLGYVMLSLSKNVPNDSAIKETEYTGRIIDFQTNKPVYNAKVIIEEEQKIPQVYLTDSDGVYHLMLNAKAKAVRIRVEADNYEIFERIISPLRTGIENIYLRRTQLNQNKSRNDSSSSTMKPPAQKKKIGGATSSQRTNEAEKKRRDAALDALLNRNSQL